MKPASYWIEKYNLMPHPEGGYFTETYRAAEWIGQDALPARFGGPRAYSTGIYFLLEVPHFSAFHRIKSDEMWHFYTGDPLNIFIIHPHSGELEVVKLGSDPEAGAIFQTVVPAGAWFASRPAPGSTYAFVGCRVAPGFDFQDFEMAERDVLINEFPAHETLIEELTY
jgi:predicted cupin superfamily sugar epimerase